MQPWTEIERDTAAHRDQLIERLVGYINGDVLLFWSTDEALLALQRMRWQPLLDDLAQTYGLCFRATLTFEQDAENAAAARCFEAYLRGLSDQKLAVLNVVAGAMRSVLLGTLFVEGHLLPQQATELSELEELYQNKAWGVDEFALERRRQLTELLTEAKGILK